MRANLLDELNKPYVVTARAKGLSEWQLVMKYPVRLAFNPLVSTIGWYLPQLFSGSLIVATVMNLPNIGPLLLRALQQQDMYLAGSILLIYCLLTIVGTLISDILLAVVDPRIRMEGAIKHDGSRPGVSPVERTVVSKAEERSFGCLQLETGLVALSQEHAGGSQCLVLIVFYTIVAGARFLRHLRPASTERQASLHPAQRIAFFR